MSKAIVLDMDGTIANFYSDYLIAEDATPYAVAEPYGYQCRACYPTKYGVCGWLSKGEPSKAFNAAVRKAKLDWLSKYYPSINPSNVHVVAHGTNKWRVSNNKGGVMSKVI